MTAANTSVGTILKVEISPGSGTYYTIGEVLNIGGPELKTDETDVTSLDSTGGYKEFIAAIKSSGVLSVEVNWVNSTEQQSLRDAISGVQGARNHIILFSDGTTFTSLGITSSISFGSQPGSQLKATFGIRLASVPVFSEAGPYVVDGDSNSQENLGPSFPQEWSLTTVPPPLENNAVGSSRLVGPYVGAPFIDRIPTDISDNPGIRSIAITWGTNDIHEYLETDALTEDQALARMKEDLIDCSNLCIAAGVSLVVSNVHYMGDAYASEGGAWTGAPWTTNRADVETLVDDINAWLTLTASPLTWTVVDVASIVNDPDLTTPGTKKMLAIMGSGAFGPHWNSYAATLIGTEFQLVLSNVVTPVPQVFSFAKSGYITLDDWNADELKTTVISHRMEWDGSNGNMQSFGNSGWFTNIGVYWNKGGSQYFCYLWDTVTNPSPYVLIQDVEYLLTYDWPGGSLDGGLTVKEDGEPALIDDETITRGIGTSAGGVFYFASGYGLANKFAGIIKDIRIWEDGYLVRDIAVNNGTAELLDKITGATYTLTDNGSGSWALL